MNASALIVDDEADIRELVEITLGRMGLTTTSAATLAQARARLAEQTFHLCLTDMRLPDGNGIDLVKHITAYHSHCPVAVITAYGNTEAAVDSLKSGAFDFVSKPVDINGLRQLTEQALKLPSDADDTSAAQQGAKASNPEAKPFLLGDTAAMAQLRTTIGKLARSQAPVYVTGESGTGKELVARTIHAQGPRAEMPFVPVNCGAIPAELMESEFFGHVKGAFTGATRDKAGLFLSADGGTLFLDEIAELPKTMQVKLLRAIQERAVRPVGAEHETNADVRIISATHKDLTQMVSVGHFREDLYYRLNVIELHTPALRERADDIPAMTERILDAFAQQLNLDYTPRLSSDAQTALCAYDFPGNVRELENILERAVTLCDEALIGPEHLRLQSPLANSTPSPDEAAGQSAPAANGTSHQDASLENQLEDIERQSITQALETTRYNKTQAARYLGITLRALRYRMKKLGIE